MTWMVDFIEVFSSRFLKRPPNQKCQMKDLTQLPEKDKRLWKTRFLFRRAFFQQFSILMC